MSTVVNLDEENSCILQVGVEADNGRRSSNGVEADDGNTRGIYRLPVWYKKQNGKDAFNPQVISLGPYHHSDALLKPMQRHKRRAFDRFFERSNTNYEELTYALKNDIEELKACYDQLRDMDDDKFLKILIEDGCFIIEFLRASAFITQFNDQTRNDYTISDPVFGVKAMKYMSPAIGRDMLLIENQIPLPVLNKLLEEDSAREIVGSQNSIQITGTIDLLWRFYHPNHRLVESTDDTDGPLQRLLSSLHILDFYRQSKLLHGNYSGGTVPSAGDLLKLGYKFRKSESSEFPDSFIDIRIQLNPNSWCSLSRGVLYLPSLSIDKATESTLLNLMAFEMFHTGIRYEVTSFILFMKSLLRSEKDVELLSCGNKFVFNEHWRQRDVAQFFSKLTIGIPLQLGRSIVKINDHRSDFRKRNMIWWFFDLCIKIQTIIQCQTTLAYMALIYALIQTYYAKVSYDQCNK